MTRSRFPLASLLLLLFHGLPAHAVDGVLEINQASVAAGGGFPVSISQAGSYRLTSNLVTSGSDGITATVDDVRIDLNGYALIGPGSCSPNIDGTGKLTSVTCSGVAGVGVEGVASLSNGTIRGFATGIEGVADRALELDRMHLTENGTGVEFATGDASLRITNSRFSVHFGPGVTTFGAVGNVVVLDSVFELNGARGLRLAAGLVSRSSFHQNGGEGIRSNSGRGAVVESCYFEDNGFGIFGNGVGYKGNVFVDNTTNVGGLVVVQLGANLCDGVLCP